MEEKVSFEETLSQLEEVVDRLEHGDPLTLDESLGAFEDGIRLARICRKQLDEAELRVQRLIEVDDDQFATVRFEDKEIEENRRE